MKICLEANQLLAYPSGARRYVFNLITNLLEVDQQNEYVLFFHFFRPRLKKKILPFRQKNVRLKFFCFPDRLTNFLWDNFNFPKLENLVGKIDLLHAPYAVLPPTKTPSILTVLDVIPFKHPDYYHNPRWYNYFRLILPKLLKRATKIIAISQSVKNDLLALFPLEKEKIKVIPLGVEEKFFLPPKEGELIAVLKKYGLKKGEYILNVAGTFEPRKNISRLLSAYQILEKKEGIDEPLIIVSGGGKNRFQPPSPKIRFLKSVSDEELVALYQAASVSIYPSLCEGFGLPILEAMAAGAPVVTSNLSAMPKTAGDSALLINPFQPKEIAAALAKILKNKSLREKLIAKGRGRARHFSWQKTAQETLRVYEEIS